MNLYFDTEFTGLHKDTTIISLGIVSENGKKFYAEFLDFDWKQVNDWIQKNVIDNMILPKFYMTNDYEKEQKKWEEKGYTVGKLPLMGNCEGLILPTMKLKNGNMKVVGDKAWVAAALEDWISQFDSVQFVSDVCHYDMVLLIDIFGSAFDLPENVSAVCHDINQDIAKRYYISEREAFDKSREEIVSELYGESFIPCGEKHNALYDAEVIKAIYEKVC